MRIGIDARELSGRPTGVGRYLACLLDTWSGLPEARAHTFVLFEPSAGPAPHRVPGAFAAGQLVRTTVAGGSGTWWEQVRFPASLAREHLDVLFAPGYTAPLVTTLPTALTVHDLSFFANPGWFTRREGARRRLLTRLSARKARTVLTVSSFSRDEIVQRLGVPAERVRVIPHGGMRPRGPDPLAGGSARESLVLFVGSIFNRRRVPDLIHAFALVARTNPTLRLEIVGDNRTHPRQDLRAIAVEAGVGGQVAVHEFVAEETLEGLYSRAAVFAFLSEYEGFGLTPLEALARGVPPLVLDTCVAREVYGDAAVYVPRGDLSATADAMRALVDNPSMRQDVLARAPAVLGRYSWERAGRDTLLAIENAALQAGSP